MANKEKKEVFAGVTRWNKEKNKPELLLFGKDKDGKDRVYDFKQDLSKANFDYLRDLSKKGPNGEAPVNNKTIVTVQGDKEYHDIYSGDVRFDQKFYDFYKYTDNNNQERLKMKTNTRPTLEQGDDDIKKAIQNKPYADVLVCLALEVEGKDGKKEYIKATKAGMFCPRRSTASADDYVKTLDAKTKEVWLKFKEQGVQNVKLARFFSVGESINVSPKSIAGEHVLKHFFKEGATDKIAFGYVPMNKFQNKHGQEEWGLNKVPTSKFFADNPMSFTVREATAEERAQFKFDEIENAVAAERAAREQAYRERIEQMNSDGEEQRAQSPRYVSFDDDNVPSYDDDEDMPAPITDDEDSPFGPSM